MKFSEDTRAALRILDVRCKELREKLRWAKVIRAQEKVRELRGEIHELRRARDEIRLEVWVRTARRTRGASKV